MPIDYSQYSDGIKRKFGDINSQYPVCNFSTHAYCAAPLMRKFTYIGCGCVPGCLSVHFEVETIIYAGWRSPLMFAPNVSVGSFMING